MRAWSLLTVLPFIATASLRSAPDCLLPLPSEHTQRAITRADAVYVFPYTDKAEHRVDKKHLRLLGGSAREKLVTILGDSGNWEQPVVVVEPDAQRSVGVVFRTSRDELVLFFNPISIDGAFGGCCGYGVLKDQPRAQLEKWKQRSAHSEIEGR